MEIKKQLTLCLNLSLSILIELILKSVRKHWLLHESTDVLYSDLSEVLL